LRPHINETATELNRDGTPTSFSIYVIRWFLRQPITASRGARLTVHLHIPFLQQLYRATTVRFRGMNSLLNATLVVFAAAFCRPLHARATGSPFNT